MTLIPVIRVTSQEVTSVRPQFPAALAALFVCLVTARAPAASVVFDTSLAGTSETFQGQKFAFTGEGTMTIDDVAGTLAYSFQLNNGFTFAGTGNAAVTAKGRIFGVVTTESNGIMGSAVVEGKASAKRDKFAVKITAAIPNRLGPPPSGFVLSKMKAKGTKQ